ncbi:MULTISPECIES: hypothetical protein [Amycolatopsis]|uniref:hypothetical protein n=1 Tax=Amycolatopsis TaxID=1813 RepID=UPI0013B4465A|nr:MULTISPECIES: hypothetical protein [Amycolatopsis]
MSAPNSLPRAGAVGFTLLVAAVVVSVWTSDWKWLLIGVAGLITAAVWSAAEGGNRHE